MLAPRPRGVILPRQRTAGGVEARATRPALHATGAPVGRRRAAIANDSASGPEAFDFGRGAAE
jgi:hypothetical protein